MTQIDSTQQRGLVIISALLNYVDWLDSQGKMIPGISKHDRGQLVLQFLASHSEGQNYFMQADDIAKRLGEPFQGDW